jgi:GMP synthase (glutamine-hydrolysing)
MQKLLETGGEEKMDGRIVVVKHVEKEGPGLIEEAFGSYGWDLDVIDLHNGGTLPSKVDQIAGVIVLGGPMNVYDQEAYPFLKDEDLFIKKLVREEVPFLGICLGAQLLAKACGAKVVKAPLREVGWYTIAVTEAGRRDRMFRGTGRSIPVFQWHEDTFSLPQGAVLLAESDPCTNQAFRVGSCAYGLQFHVEVTAEMVAAWLDDEADIDRKKIEREGEKARSAFVRQSALVLRNFRKLTESSLRVKKVVDMFVESKPVPKTTLWWNLETRSLGTAH